MSLGAFSLLLCLLLVQGEVVGFLQPFLSISSVASSRGGRPGALAAAPAPGGGILHSRSRSSSEENLEAWATKEAEPKFSTASLKHHSFDGLRGLQAIEAVRPWATLVSVPESHLLWVYRSRPEEPPAELASALSSRTWERLPWFCRLAVILALERLKGDSSHWAAYVNNLPSAEELDVPLAWPHEHVQALRYPHLLSQLSARKRLISVYGDCLVAELADCATTQEEKFLPTKLLEALSDPSFWDWHVSLVLSRAFELPPDNVVPFFPEPDASEEERMRKSPPAVAGPLAQEARVGLVPLIDSINHYSRISTHMHWAKPADDMGERDNSGARNNGQEGRPVAVDEAGGRRQERELAVSTGMAFAAGEQVYLSFGRIPNDDLLQSYGFVERDTPSDYYVLSSMGRWLLEEGTVTRAMQTALLSCGDTGRQLWRHLRRGVVTGVGPHPLTMYALRVAASWALSENDEEAGEEGKEGEEVVRRWEGSEEDLLRFKEGCPAVVELKALEAVMLCCCKEEQLITQAGEEERGSTSPSPSSDPLGSSDSGSSDSASQEEREEAAETARLQKAGISGDRLIMASAFTCQRLRLLRKARERVVHLVKVTTMLGRPVQLPPVMAEPVFLGLQ